jgi:hypothetical protein
MTTELENGQAGEPISGRLSSSAHRYGVCLRSWQANTATGWSTKGGGEPARTASLGPLLVGGQEIVISGYPRFDNEWAQVERGATVVDIGDELGRLSLDLAGGRRQFGP